MTENSASNQRPPIELEVEVDGSPEEVWAAIATGPGISSWYVPHVIEEREGGTLKASFGPGPEMEGLGRVAKWDPPRRVVFDGGESVEGLAFEWLIESTGAGTCIVRLVNSGFLADGEWDDYYDGMTDGWRIFLANLALHCTHFLGQQATPSLPTATWPLTSGEAWRLLTTDLGIDSAPLVGDRIEISQPDVPKLAGEVVTVTSHHISLLVDTPAPGTAFIAAEGRGDSVEVSIWSYLYGEAGKAASTRVDQVWRQWLADRA